MHMLVVEGGREGGRKEGRPTSEVWITDTDHHSLVTLGQEWYIILNRL